METQPGRRPPDPRIRPALEHLQANPHHPVKLSDLAARAGLSPARFSHLFTLATGTTPGRYLRRLRQQRPEIR